MNYIIGQFTVLEQDEIIKNVCNGKLLRPKRPNLNLNVSTTLGCSYLHNEDRYLKCGPFKFELQYADPYRLVLHDFLTTHNINQIEKEIKPRLTHTNMQPLLIDQDASNNTDTDIYDAATIYFGDDHISDNKNKNVSGKMKEEYIFAHDKYELNVSATSDERYHYSKSLATTITNRIKMATYLQGTDHEHIGKYKASLYGLAGMTERHSDSYGVEEGRSLSHLYSHFRSTGDNMVTVMFHITDVAFGGSTYFCSKDHEGSLSSEKGAALIWFNLKPSGFPDENQWHGGCPVAAGMKFVVTRWFKQYHQWRKFPCLLDKDTTVDISVLLKSY